MEGMNRSCAPPVPTSPGAIIIPAYNEEKTVSGVVGEIRTAGIEWDIIVVDDGSSDSTRDIVGTLPVTRIGHPINLGYGAAVQTGLRYAVRRGYSRVILMDGDGQHVPAEIPKLLRALDGGADIAIGSRFLGMEEGYPIPFLRRIGITFFSRLAKFLGGTRILDVTSGFQAMRRPVAEYLAEEYPVDFPDAEVIISLGLKRFRIQEVATMFRAREHGISMYSNPFRAMYYPFKTLLASFVALLRLIRNR